MSRSIAASPYRKQARLRVRGTKQEIAKRFPPWVGVLEPPDAESCALTIGGDTHEAIAAFIVHAGVEFDLLDPLEMARPLREIAARLKRGVRGA